MANTYYVGQLRNSQHGFTSDQGDLHMPNQLPIFYKNPSIATILSFFWMGLGQIYNGQIGKGVAFMVSYVISWLLMFIIIGFVTTPVLWIWGMVDANNSAKKIKCTTCYRVVTECGEQCLGQITSNLARVTVTWLALFVLLSPSRCAWAFGLPCAH
jgi:TM2 domain-containing membrane protein YozV